ncbi:MAG: adenosylmethionine--8-amino-7-oxononanoate transaminase [Rhodospirillales bacterium]
MKDPKAIIAADKNHIWHPFTQAQTAPDAIPIVRGDGAKLFDADGNEYLDLISSWWVNTHGHGHPKIAGAIARQAEQLEHVIFAGFTHEPAVRLAEKLSNVLPGDLSRVFYSDNGSTAVEVALKLTFQYWRNKGEARKKFLAFEGGYHGDTVGAMSVGQSSGFFDAWQELLFDVGTLPFPATWQGDDDVETKEQKSFLALEQYLNEHGADTCAMILEPLVQGAGGMRMCRPEFLKSFVQKLQTAGVLVIFDEVMTGFGRTGDLFACRKADVVPDIICLSKGLTGGFMPLSATVCRDELYAAFLDESFDKAFTHGHSFTANPLGCAAALASLELTVSSETQSRIDVIAKIHKDRLEKLAAFAPLECPRQTGTIAAIDVKAADSGYTAGIGPALKAYFMERGLLIRPLGNVMYVLPPYCIADEDLHRAYDGIEAAVQTIL